MKGFTKPSPTIASRPSKSVDGFIMAQPWRLHIPHKKWSYTSQLAHPHEAEQNWLRIEDWASRLVDRVGQGGIPMYLDGRRFVRLDVNNAATWASGYTTPLLLHAPHSQAWAVKVSAMFTLAIEVSVEAGTAPASVLDITYKIDPTTDADSGAMTAPIAHHHHYFDPALTSGTQHATFNYEHMILAPQGDIPDTILDPPADSISRIWLLPVVNIEWLAGGADTPKIVAVESEVSLHAVVISNPNTFFPTNPVPNYDNSAPDDNTIFPANTVRWGGSGGGGGEGEYEGGPWAITPRWNGVDGWAAAPEVGSWLGEGPGTAYGGNPGPDEVVVPIEAAVSAHPDLTLTSGALVVDVAATYTFAAAVNLAARGTDTGTTATSARIAIYKNGVYEGAGSWTSDVEIEDEYVLTLAGVAVAATSTDEIEVVLEFSFGSPHPEFYTIWSATDLTLTVTTP